VQAWLQALVLVLAWLQALAQALVLTWLQVLAQALVLTWLQVLVTQSQQQPPWRRAGERQSAIGLPWCWR